MEENKSVDFELYDYQYKAVENIDEILENTRFAGAVMPTGAGKSFVAMKEILKAGGNDYLSKTIDNPPINEASIMYVAPTNEILLQIQRNIVKYILKQNVEDKSVKEIEEMVEKAFPNLRLVCYAGLRTDMKETNKMENYKADLVILDEVHRSGGAESQKAVSILLGCNNGKNGPEYDKEKNENKKNMKVLAISATPERDVDGRNMMSVWAEALGYSKEEADNEKYLGIDMSLSEAINKDKVVEPEVIHFDGNLGESKEYKHLVNLYKNSKNNSKLRDELRKTLDKINNEIIGIENYHLLSPEEQEEKRFERSVQTIIQAAKAGKLNKYGKYMLFVPHNRTKEGKEKEDTKEHLEKYGTKFKKMIENAGLEVELSYLSSAFKDKENRETLNYFSNQSDTEGKMKIILASDKLNEGVHVEGISGAFMERNVSEGQNTNKRAQTILFLQQIGRCIFTKTDKWNGKRTVIFDTANNFFKQNRDNPQEEYSKINLFKLTPTQKEFVKLYNLALLNLPEKTDIRNKLPRLFNILDILTKYGFKPNNKLISQKTTLDNLLSQSPLLEQKDEILRELKEEGLYNSNKKYNIGKVLYEAKESFWKGTKFFENYSFEEILKYGIIDPENDNLEEYGKKSYVDLETGFIKMGVVSKFIGLNIYTGREVDKDGRDIEGNYPGEFDEEGYSINDGYNKYGFDRNGIHKFTKTIHDIHGFMADGKNIQTGDEFDLLGYNIDGIKPVCKVQEIPGEMVKQETIVGGWDRRGIWHLLKEDGTFSGPISKYSEGVEPKVDVHGFYSHNKNHSKTGEEIDFNGFYKLGDCINPYIEDGGTQNKYYNKEGLDIDGFDKDGFNIFGVHKLTGTRLNLLGESKKFFTDITKTIKMKLEKLSIEQKQLKLKIYEDGKFHYKDSNGKEIIKTYNKNYFNTKGINIFTNEYTDLFGFGMIDYYIANIEKQRVNKFGFRPSEVPRIVAGKNLNDFYKRTTRDGKVFKYNILGTDESGKNIDGKLHPALDVADKYIEKCMKEDKTIEEFVIEFAKTNKMLVPEAKVEIIKSLNQAVTLYRICPELQKSEQTKEVAKIVYNASSEKIENFMKLCPGLKSDLKREIGIYLIDIKNKSNELADLNKNPNVIENLMKIYNLEVQIEHDQTRKEEIEKIFKLDFD